MPLGMLISYILLFLSLLFKQREPICFVMYSFLENTVFLMLCRFKISRHRKIPKLHFNEI